MFTKHKIRRAFERATPDVLSGILQECSAVQENNLPAHEAVAPVTPLRWMPHWLKETVATAAAFALLITVLGSVIYFGSTQLHTGNTEPTGDNTKSTTAPTTEPTVESVPPTVNPTDPDEPSPPDGNIGSDLATQLALESVNLTKNDVTNLTCVFDDSTEGNSHYLVSFDTATTHYDIQIHAYSMEILSCKHYSIVSKELEKFNELFGDMNSWYNRALTSMYKTPNNLDLHALFYNGFSDESDQFTDAEWKGLKNEPNLQKELSVARLPVEKMNDILTTYFGVELKDITYGEIKGLVYLESTNCYYHTHSDSRAIEAFQATRIEHLADGLVQIYYTCFFYDFECVVTVKPLDNGTYQIISNMAAASLNPTGEIEIIGTQDGIPIIMGIDYNEHMLGFFWNSTGTSAISIHNGKPEYVDIRKEHVVITHNDRDYAFDFSWCTNAGEIGVYPRHPSVTPILGNDQFVCLSVDNGSGYVYLYDLQTKQIIDPLHAADMSVFGEISSLSFFPNGTHALVYCDLGPIYLNIATGETISVQEMTGCKDGFGVSIVNNDLIALEYVEGKVPQEYYADCYIYDLTDGSTRTLYTDTFFGWLNDVGGIESFQGVHVHHHNGSMCIVDCVTGIHSQTDLPNSIFVGSCTGNSVYIQLYSGSDMVYLVDSNGSATPVFLFEYGLYYDTSYQI